MHIALFGGSFDPPHLGHVLVANSLLAKNYVDMVWFVPCADHPFQKKLTDGQQRVEMLKKLQHPVCAYELQKEGKSYSIETLEYMQKLFPADTFSWVIGADQLADFHTWHRYADILNFQVFVYPRDNFPLTPILPGMTVITDVASSNISSTKVRQVVSDGGSIDALTTKDIAAYIKTNNLYTHATRN